MGAPGWLKAGSRPLNAGGGATELAEHGLTTVAALGFAQGHRRLGDEVGEISRPSKLAVTEGRAENGRNFGSRRRENDALPDPNIGRNRTN